MNVFLFELRAAIAAGGIVQISDDRLKYLHDELGKLLLVPSKKTLFSHTNTAQALIDNPDATIEQLRKALQTQVDSVRHYATLARMAEEDYGHPVYCIFMDSEHPMVCCSTDPDVELRIAEQVTALLWMKGLQAGSHPDADIQKQALALAEDKARMEGAAYVLTLVRELHGNDVYEGLIEYARQEEE
jgi:hypothetical protein